MHRSLSAAFFAAALGVSAVHAADLTYPTDPVMAVTYGSTIFAWDGFYAGVNAGYGFGRATTNAPGTPQMDMRGWEGGVQAGYNFNIGGFVIGAEADAQLSNISYSMMQNNQVTDALNLNYFGTVRARAGFAVDRFMPYVTGGFAYGQGSGSFSLNGGTFSETKNHLGWTAGLGVEVQATDNITGKLEYIYTDLGTQTYYAGLGFPQTANVNFGTIRAGLNFHF
jgi:outer membrane immunogenic protein